MAANARLRILNFKIEDIAPSDDIKYFLSVPHWLEAPLRSRGTSIFTVTGVAECWRGRSKSPRCRWPRRSGRAWIGEERGDAVLRHAFGSGSFRHGLLHPEVVVHEVCHCDLTRSAADSMLVEALA